MEEISKFYYIWKIRTPVEMRYTTLGKIPQKGIPFLNPSPKEFLLRTAFFRLKVFTGISCCYCIIFTDPIQIKSIGSTPKDVTPKL